MPAKELLDQRFCFVKCWNEHGLILGYICLQAGYILHDRVIRPAEVGVTQAVEENNPAE